MYPKAKRIIDLISFFFLPLSILLVICRFISYIELKVSNVVSRSVEKRKEKRAKTPLRLNNDIDPWDLPRKKAPWER